MNILLINTNPVVSRLISLCMRDDAISLEEVEQVTEVTGSTYDIVFVDDAAYNDKVAAFSAWVANIGKLVFLSSRDTGEEIGGKFDLVIKKPFLPSQIQEVIEQVRVEKEQSDEEDKETEGLLQLGQIEESDTGMPEDEDVVLGSVSEEQEDEAHFIFPLAVSTESGEESQEEESISQQESSEEGSSEDVPQVLDEKEIEQIKALLEEDEIELPEVDLEDAAQIEARKVEVITQKLKENGLEIVNEESIIDELSRTPVPEEKEKKKAKKQKKKKRKKKKQKSEEVYTFEEALLAAIENMKPKKIKKLLKGAEVSIKIRFKDEK